MKNTANTTNTVKASAQIPGYQPATTPALQPPAAAVKQNGTVPVKVSATGTAPVKSAVSPTGILTGSADTTPNATATVKTPITAPGTVSGNDTDTDAYFGYFLDTTVSEPETETETNARTEPVRATGTASEMNAASEIKTTTEKVNVKEFDYDKENGKDKAKGTVQETVSEKEKATQTGTAEETDTGQEEVQNTGKDEKVTETASGQVAVNGNGNGNVFSGSVSLSRSGIINLGRPTPYRGDCQMGKFKIKANPVSDTLDFTVLAIRHLQGEFFNYDYQDWIEIIFVDEKKIVSAMLLKTESMDNFGLTTKFILSSGKRLIDVVVTGCFVKKTSVVNKSSYYALEFRFRDNDPETVKEIETFMETCDVTKITGLNF